MAREAKIILTSENKIGAGVKSAEGDLDRFGASAQKIGKVLSTAFTATAIIAVTKKIAEFGVEAVKAFGESERSMIQLKTALGGSESAVSRMTGLIDSLSRKTLESRGSVEQMVATLASFGRSEKEINAISEAAIALSNATGKTLNEAFTSINKSFAGTVGELGELIPETKKLTAEQLKAGGAADILNAKFGAISDQMASGVSQSFKNLGDSMGTLKNAIGGFLEPVFSPMLGWLDSLVSGWAKNIEAANTYRGALKDMKSDQREIAIEGEILKLTMDFQKIQAKQKEDLEALGIDTFEKWANSAARVGEANTYAEYTKLFAEVNDKYSKDLKDTAHRIEALRDELKTYATPPPTPTPTTPPASGAGPGPATTSTAAPETQPITYGVNHTWDTVKAARILQMGISEEEYDRQMNEQNGTPGYGKSTDTSNSEQGDSDKNKQVSFLDKFMEKMGGLDGVFQKMGSSLGGVAGEIVNATASMGPMGLLMVGLEKVFDGIVQVLGPLIDNFLAPIIDILKLFGQVIGQMLAPAFQILTPIVQGLAKLFTWLYNKVFVPVHNFSMSIFNTIYNAFADFVNAILSIIDAIPFVDVGRVEKRSRDAGFISEIDVNGAGSTSQGAAGSGSSGYSSGSGAVYTGSQPITQNFFNYGTMVGDGGLEEFAKIIVALINKQARYS